MNVEICHCEKKDGARGHIFDLTRCDYRPTVAAETPPNVEGKDEGSEKGSETAFDAPLTPQNHSNVDLEPGIKSPQLYRLSYGPKVAESQRFPAGTAPVLNGGAPPGSETGSEAGLSSHAAGGSATRICAPCFDQRIVCKRLPCAIHGPGAATLSIPARRGAAGAPVSAAPVAGGTPVVPDPDLCEVCEGALTTTDPGCTIGFTGDHYHFRCADTAALNRLTVAAARAETRRQLEKEVTPGGVVPKDYGCGTCTHPGLCSREGCCLSPQRRACPSAGCGWTIEQHLEAGHTPQNHVHLATALRQQRGTEFEAMAPQRRALDLCACGHTRAAHVGNVCSTTYVGCACTAFTPRPQPRPSTIVDDLQAVVQAAAQKAGVVARLFMLPSGRWQADITGPGEAWRGTSTPDLEKAVFFIARRLGGAL